MAWTIRVAQIVLPVLWGSTSALVFAQPIDEPGLQPSADEPGLERDWLESEASAPPTSSKHIFRLELGGGLSSLVVDPDVHQGYGGGLYLGYAYGRMGAELSAFLGRNNYSGDLGSVGSVVLDAFIAGNVTLSPTFRLTPPGSSLDITLDLGAGLYPIANAIQRLVWTFGMSAGLSVGYRITPWLGVGVKARYHLFNLTRLGGDDLLDRATLQTLGVIDRLEVPIYIGFYY